MLPAQAEPDTASQTGEADFVTGSDVATTEDESLRSAEEGVLPAHPDPDNTTQQADTSDSSTFTQQEAPANLPHRTSSEVATEFSKEWTSINPGTLETPLAPYHHSTITHQQDTTHQVISPPALVSPPKCIHTSQDDPKDSGIPVSDTSNEKDGRHDSSSRQSKTPDRVVITHTNMPHTYTGQVSNLEGKSTRQEVRERVTPERCPNSDRPPRSRLKRKCPKRLKHPSHRRGGSEYPQTFEQTKGNNSHTRELKPAQSDSYGDYSNPPRTTTETVHKNPPKSRSKRKCRFGPRARRLRQGRQQHGKTQGAAPSKLSTCDSFKQKASGIPQLPTHSQPLPDGVTPQHADCPKRTPLDKGKKGYTLETEALTIQHSAGQLGTPETDLDAPTTEIDDLLNKIELTRRTTLEPPAHGQGEINLDFPAYQQANKHKTSQVTGLRTSPPNSKPSEDPYHIGGFFNEGSSTHAFDPDADRPQFGSKEGGPQNNDDRGKGKDRTSVTQGVLPPSPPLPCPSGVTESTEAAAISWAAGTLLQANRVRLDLVKGKSHHERDDPNEDQPIILPDIPTLSNFSATYSSPFWRYLGLPEVVTKPGNHIPIHKRLGISEASFDALSYL